MSCSNLQNNKIICPIFTTCDFKQTEILTNKDLIDNYLNARTTLKNCKLQHATLIKCINDFNELKTYE